MIFLIIFFQIFGNFSSIEEKIGYDKTKEFFPQNLQKAIFLINLEGNNQYLEKLKIKPIGFIKENNFLIYIDKNQWEKLYNDKKTKSLKHFKKDWKLNIREKTNCYRYLKVENNELKTHKICMDFNDILNFAKREDIAYIENDWNIFLRNDNTAWVIQSNEENYYPYTDENLKGEGEIIGHIDTQIYVDSCYFVDEQHEIGPEHRKIVGYRSPSTTEKEAHGTHTAGTAAGEASGQPNNGIAPKAKLSYTNILYISGIGNEDSNLYNYLELAHQDGARIHTNSWGDDSTNQYTTLCYDIDKFSYDNLEDVIIFSVTNYSKLKSPENAKNLISVGATYPAPNQDKICSGGKGPTIDGRLKPDFFVPGCSIKSASAISQCSTLSLSGTSMSSPAVAGASAIAREYLKKKYHRSIIEPSGSLIKAILINSGEDLKSISGYPNFEEGWGRVLLKKTLPLENSEYKLFIDDIIRENGLNEGEEKVYNIRVSFGNLPLSITLVWTDYPAFPSSNQILINDLNLIVKTPSGKTYKGNLIENGELIEGGEYDNKNNVERVILNNPEVGDYEIRVFGKAIPMAPQGFSIVITGEILKNSNYFFPVISNNLGDKNSNWKTAIWIYNNSQSGQRAKAIFYLNGNEYVKEINLNPYEILCTQDPLKEWFQIDNGYGGMKIETQNPIKGYIRIYNLSEKGTYGQSYNSFSSAYNSGDIIYFSGLFLSNEKRTNFGVTNFGETISKVNLSLYDSLGNLLGEKEMSLNKGQNIQQSIKTLFPEVSILNSGFLSVEILEGKNLIPYVSVIANSSNDGIFVLPDKINSKEKFLPVVVGNANPTGYPWKSELFIFSEMNNVFNGNLRVLQGTDWKDFNLNININAYQPVYIEDLFDYLNLNDGVGYLTFDGEFILYERIYSGENISNFYGQFLKATEKNLNKKIHYLYGTIPDENFRANLGLSNPHNVPIQCNAAFFNSSGTKIFEKVIGVDSKNFIQYPIKEIFSDIPIGEPLLINLNCDDNLYAYVSLVDNRTSDGSFFSDF